jgi:CheY-like chemotaxis protein
MRPAAGHLPSPVPRALLRAMIGFVLLCALGQQADAQEPQPRILILNAYHQGETWSDNEIAGIEKVNAKTAAELPVNGFLMKPVDKEKLAKTVRRALDKARGLMSR